MTITNTCCEIQITDEQAEMRNESVTYQTLSFFLILCLVLFSMQVFFVTLLSSCLTERLQTVFFQLIN